MKLQATNMERLTIFVQELHGRKNFYWYTVIELYQHLQGIRAHKQ